MPIYEYRRPDGTTFDIQQSFSDEPLAVDPETGVPVERVLHPPAVHFKGKGFYNTDYGTRKRQRENAAAADKKPSSSDGASGGGDSSGSTDKKGDTGAKADKGGKSEGGSSSGSAKESKPLAAKG
jgi:predicted nucleic acid-binding Zn ribbon protein